MRARAMLERLLPRPQSRRLADGLTLVNDWVNYSRDGYLTLGATNETHSLRLAPHLERRLLPGCGQGHRLARQSLRLRAAPQSGGRGRRPRALRAGLRRGPRDGRTGRPREEAGSALPARPRRRQHPGDDGLRRRRRGALQARPRGGREDRRRTGHARLRGEVLDRSRLRVRGPGGSPLVVLPAAARSEGKRVSDLDRTFAALADPTRRGVIALLRKKPRRAGELAEWLSL